MERESMEKITKLEQRRLEREQLKEESLRHQLGRQVYLKTLGLDKEIIISLSTLKEIFTDKNIKLHFPVPYDTTFNPNLSKPYQRDDPKAMMKLYLLARVLEKIAVGVKPRIKESLKDEYKTLLRDFIIKLEAETLERELTINEHRKKTIHKI